MAIFVAHFDTHELDDLADGLEAAHDRTKEEAPHVVADAGDRLVEGWQRNARETALPHGRHYPGTIGYDGPIEAGLGVHIIAGPDSAMPQGGMGKGFELGSINQDSPHLDGNRALDALAPRFSRDVLDWSYDVLVEELETHR